MSAIIFDRDDVATFARRRRNAPAHAHRCPGCYEPDICGLTTCNIEPDLTLDSGTPCGAYATCKRCGGAS